MNKKLDLLGRFRRLELNWRLMIDSKILISSDPSSARRMWISSLYLQNRALAQRRAVRSGLWNADGLYVTMPLTLHPGDIFLDIGANVGWVTQTAAWLVGRHGKVYSFEPSPSTAHLLRRRLICMGISNVVVNEVALGAANGFATLYECSENFGGSSSLRPGAAPGQHISGETQVAVKPLDEYIEHNSISKVSLIKMDVQGSEIDVLRGARQVLTAPNRPVLFVEIEQVTNAAFGYKVDDLINEIAGLGYSLYSWRENGLVDIKSEKDIPLNGHDDVICLCPDLHNELYDQFQSLGRRPKFRPPPLA